MQCVYSAFIFRYRLVPTGSENPKVCVRDVCREFACELESIFVGVGLLLLSFLHFTTNLPKTDCSAKKREGARAEMVHSETSRSLHCTHRPREGTEKRKKNYFTPSHSVPPTGGLTTSQKTDASLCWVFCLLSSEGEVNVRQQRRTVQSRRQFSIGEEAVAGFIRWNFLLPVSARIIIQVTVCPPSPSPSHFASVLQDYSYKGNRLGRETGLRLLSVYCILNPVAESSV